MGGRQLLCQKCEFVETWSLASPVSVMGETRIWRSRPRPRLSFWVSWDRDRGRDFYFEPHGIEIETETFLWGLTRLRLVRDKQFFSLTRPRPVLRPVKSRNHKFKVSRDRDLYQDQKSLGTEGLGTETAHLWLRKTLQNLSFLVGKNNQTKRKKCITNCVTNLMNLAQLSLWAKSN